MADTAPEDLRTLDNLGTVATLRRYPIKSVLGEELSSVPVTSAGLQHDRSLAFIDTETGLVATAKHPRLWRSLLSFTAAVQEQTIALTFPDGSVVLVDRPGIDQAVSRVVGREVTLSGVRPEAAEVERPDPEDVLAHGVDAVVDSPTLQIAQGTTGSNFVDYAPVHLITTTTLEHLGQEALRYRPNIVIATPADFSPYGETEWVGREFNIGAVRLRGILPTPRCSVPTLEHGDLPRAPEAVRRIIKENRIDVEGFGTLPCAGVYAEVLSGGEITVGDTMLQAAGT